MALTSTASIQVDGLSGRACGAVWTSRARPVVLCAGRLCEQKGQDLLFEAWPTIASAVPDAVLVIVGDGPMREEVRDTAARSTSVRWAGGGGRPRALVPRRRRGRGAEPMGGDLALVPLEAWRALGPWWPSTSQGSVRVSATLAPGGRPGSRRARPGSAERLLDLDLAADEGQRGRERAARMFDARQAGRPRSAHRGGPARPDRGPGPNPSDGVRMRVAYVGSLERGGPPDLAAALAVAIAEDDDTDVRVFAPPPTRGSATLDGLLEPTRIDSWAEALEVRRRVAAWQPDLVHFHDRRASLVAAAFTGRRQRPALVLTYHGVPEDVPPPGSTEPAARRHRPATRERPWPPTPWCSGPSTGSWCRP